MIFRKMLFFFQSKIKIIFILLHNYKNMNIILNIILKYDILNNLNANIKKYISKKNSVFIPKNFKINGYIKWMNYFSKKSILMKAIYN